MGMSQGCPHCGKLTTHFTYEEYITIVDAWTSHDMSTLWKPFVACFIFEEFITGVDVNLICRMCRLWKQLWAQRLLVQVKLYCIFYTWGFSTIMDSNVCLKTCVSPETFATHFTVDRFFCLVWSVIGCFTITVTHIDWIIPQIELPIVKHPSSKPRSACFMNIHSTL
jgi:hypothetical protein